MSAPDPVAGPVAIGWATVELERAVVELGDRLLAGSGFEAAPDSELLGARCLVGRLADPATATWLVLLEPATEGRLSATLARHGEGEVATWTDRPAAPGVAVATNGTVRWSVVRPGPLGPERLRLDGPVFGPHRLARVAATIEP
jgi:hypothetical protein